MVFEAYRSPCARRLSARISANAAFLAARATHGDDDFSAVYEQQKAAK